MYNNYIIDPNNLYRGNFPWNEDINVIDTETLITIIIIIAFVGIIIVVFIVNRNAPNDRIDPEE